MLDRILFHISGSKNQDQLIKELSEFLVTNGISSSESKVLFEQFDAREKQSSTNLNEGFAIPHIITSDIKEPCITFIRLKQPIAWGPKEENLKKISFILAISLPKGQGDKHLSIISSLSTKLVDKDFIKGLKSGSKNLVVKQISDTLNGNLTTKSSLIATSGKSKKDSQKIKIVAITTCPTGIAHTHMAAESLEIAARALNIDLHVEKQAAEGVVNGLTEKKIAEADYCLFAIGKNIDRSRFVGKKCYEIKIADAIKDGSKVLKDTQTNSTVYAASNSGASTKPEAGGVKARHSNPIMNALMNGLSFMIPVIITGGILLAVSIGIGSAIYGANKIPADSFFGVIQSLGGTAFTIMIPILGAYIAYAIGDKAAMAPAFILSLFCNSQSPVDQNITNVGFWNWEKMQFGGFNLENPPVLGFFGAIAVGLLVGYMVRYMKLLPWPKVIRSIVPIFIIPISTTFIIWFFIAFFGYVPLYYLSYGLKLGIEKLVSLNILWLVGIILGAMIAFDMGGPINKVAFLIGATFLGQANPNGLLMGADAAAIGVPPMGLALGVLINNYIFKRKNSADNELAKTAGIIGALGITEGAIPFVIKNPRLIIANVLGGMTAGGIAAGFNISNSVAHGSIIVYLLGAIGHQSSVSSAIQTNYAYGLWYIFAILMGCLVTAGMSVVLYKKPISEGTYTSILE